MGCVQVRLLNIGELRKDSIGALTFGAEIPSYKDGALPTAPKLRYAFPTAPTWQVSHRPAGGPLLFHPQTRCLYADCLESKDGGVGPFLSLQALNGIHWDTS